MVKFTNFKQVFEFKSFSQMYNNLPRNQSVYNPENLTQMQISCEKVVICFIFQKF